MNIDLSLKHCDLNQMDEYGFKQMKEHGFIPDERTWILTRWKNLDFNQMNEYGFKSDECIWV